MKLHSKLATWVAALTLGLGFASKADAVMLVVGGAGYVGYYTPGNANGPDEPLLVNELTAMMINTNALSAVDNSQTLFRTSNVFATLPTVTGSVKDDDDSNDQVVGSDSVYTLGKYGNDGIIGPVAHVWYIGDIAPNTPITLPSQGLSHTTLMSGTRRVPEGGTTLVLIGMALVSIGVAKKRLVS